nr:hypothetical protein [Tanacetum cinerariifolium]
ESDRRRTVNTARGCTYKEFLNCQPLNCEGTEGDVGLAQWFAKIESIFHISNCVVECQVKYAICTLLNGALTWWNSHVRTVGHDATYEMSWKDLMKMMTEAYFPRNEIQKLENELGNLTVKDTDVVGYTQRFQELVLLCPRMAPEEEDKADHLARDCNGTTAATDQKAPVANQRTLTCFECGNQGHYRSECSKLKNQNCGNQTGNGKARGRVYALGGADADQDPNNIADDTDA